MSDLIALCMMEGLCHLLSTLFAQNLTNGIARVLQSLIKKEQTPCEEPCEGHEEGAEEEEPEEDEEIQEETEEEPEEEDAGDETENSEEGPGRENKRPRLADGPRLVRGRWGPAVMLRYLVDRQGLDYWDHHISAGILRRHHPVPRADLFGDRTEFAWHVSPVKREYLRDRRTTILNEQGVVLTIFDQLASPYALPASIKQRRWWGFTDFRLSRPEDLRQVEEVEAVDFSRPVETFNSWNLKDNADRVQFLLIWVRKKKITLQGPLHWFSACFIAVWMLLLCHLRCCCFRVLQCECCSMQAELCERKSFVKCAIYRIGGWATRAFQVFHHYYVSCITVRFMHYYDTGSR